MKASLLPPYVGFVGLWWREGVPCGHKWGYSLVVMECTFLEIQEWKNFLLNVENHVLTQLFFSLQERHADSLRQNQHYQVCSSCTASCLHLYWHTVGVSLLLFPTLLCQQTQYLQVYSHWVICKVPTLYYYSVSLPFVWLLSKDGHMWLQKASSSIWLP